MVLVSGRFVSWLDWFDRIIRQKLLDSIDRVKPQYPLKKNTPCKVISAKVCAQKSWVYFFSKVVGTNKATGWLWTHLCEVAENVEPDFFPRIFTLSIGKFVFQFLHTLLETNISPTKALLKMIVLFPRWDTLIPWRAILKIHFFYIQKSLGGPNLGGWF